MIKDPRLKELKWYKLHGKYPDRVVVDSTRQKYVIGDLAWHRAHPYRTELIEYNFKIPDGIQAH